MPPYSPMPEHYWAPTDQMLVVVASLISVGYHLIAPPTPSPPGCVISLPTLTYRNIAGLSLVFAGPWALLCYGAAGTERSRH